MSFNIMQYFATALAKVFRATLMHPLTSGVHSTHAYVLRAVINCFNTYRNILNLCATHRDDDGRI